MDKNRIISHCKHAAVNMRKTALQMALQVGSTGSHLGGGLSMIELMATLYMGVMQYDVQHPENESRDRFILSKGHGVLALYTALNQAGFIPDEDLATFKQNETYLYGHPSMDMQHGIEFSSGSLGQGLSLGVGCCLGMKRKSNTQSRVYVLLGDGECDEGSVWEAAASASHFGLNQLVAIVDKNGLQYDGKTEEILSMDNMAAKWREFGWDVIEIDGHNVESCYNALSHRSDKPVAVIAHTIKGKGVSFMENNPLWHNSRLSQKQYEQAMAEQEVGL